MNKLKTFYLRQRFKFNNIPLSSVKGLVFDIDELIRINNKHNLKTIIISSSDQSGLIDKKIDFKVLDNLDEKFKNFII